MGPLAAGCRPSTPIFFRGGGGRLILCIRREVYLSIIFSVWSTFPAKMDALLRMRVHPWHEMWKNETQLTSK